MPAKIQVKGIRKSYVSEHGTLKVVDGVDFSVEKGEFVAIVGPSGCGKSTLMNIIVGFLAADEGAVLIDGVERHHPHSKGIMISQQGSIFPWMTVRENLVFGLDGLDGVIKDKGKLADHYAALVGLNGFENSYPRELSGGMLKRAEIARALVVRPEILYMDEPFSALDALTSLRIRNELLRILPRERQTVILITHDVEEAVHLADRVLILSGRPTKIRLALEIRLPRPRKLSSPEAQILKDTILRELGIDPAPAIDIAPPVHVAAARIEVPA